MKSRFTEWFRRSSLTERRWAAGCLITVAVIAVLMLVILAAIQGSR